MPLLAAGTSPPKLPNIIGHRGYKDDTLPGNTMQSFTKARDVGAQTIELDVRKLADGTLVVHHDERWMSKPLRVVDKGFVDRDHPERPPTLDEVARFAHANNLRMNVELKEAGYERAVLDTLLSHVPMDRMTFMSFDQDAVQGIKQLRPDARAGLLFYELPVARVLQQTFAPSLPINKARSVGADFLAVHRAMASERLIDRSERAGMPLSVWTVDDRQQLTRLLSDPRVDNVITNRPDVAHEVAATIPTLRR